MYYMVSEMIIDIPATMCIISIESPDNGAPEREEPFIWVVSFFALGADDGSKIKENPPAELTVLSGPEACALQVDSLIWESSLWKCETPLPPAVILNRR